MAEVACNPRPPICPRCGYDQTGQQHAAQAASPDSFPTQGTCSECGLEYWWGDIFNPSLSQVPGFIEQQPGRLFWAACRTWWLCLRPRTFWTRVRMELEPRPGRVALWCFILIPLPLLLAAVLCTVLFPWHPLAHLAGDGFLVELWSMGLALQEYRNGKVGPVWLQALPVCVLGPLTVSLFLPLLLLCLPDTRRISRIRASHIARGAGYGLAWLVPAILLRALWLSSSMILAIVTPMTGGRFQMELHRVRRLLIHAFDGLLEASPVLLFVIMAWIMLWWHAALKRGWRIRQCNRVWWALMIPAWLVVAITALFNRFGLQIF